MMRGRREKEGGQPPWATTYFLTCLPYINCVLYLVYLFVWFFIIHPPLWARLKSKARGRWELFFRTGLLGKRRGGHGTVNSLREGGVNGYGTASSDWCGESNESGRDAGLGWSLERIWGLGVSPLKRMDGLMDGWMDGWM